MKINPVNCLIAIALSAIIAFALWSVDGELKNYVAVGAFVFFAGTLVPMLGGNYECARNEANLRVMSGIFFVIGLVINGLFSAISYSATAYIIISSLAFLVYIFVSNAIYGTKQ